MERKEFEELPDDGQKQENREAAAANGQPKKTSNFFYEQLDELLGEVDAALVRNGIRPTQRALIGGVLEPPYWETLRGRSIKFFRSAKGGGLPFHDAEDCTSKLYIKLRTIVDRNPHRLPRTRDEAAGWLFRVVTNHGIDHHRASSRRRDQAQGGEGPAPQADPTPGPLQQLIAKEEQAERKAECQAYYNQVCDILDRWHAEEDPTTAAHCHRSAQALDLWLHLTHTDTAAVGCWMGVVRRSAQRYLEDARDMLAAEASLPVKQVEAILKELAALLRVRPEMVLH